MKKFIIATVLVLTTGVLSSQTSVHNATTSQSLITKATLSVGNKELANGD